MANDDTIVNSRNNQNFGGFYPNVLGKSKSGQLYYNKELNTYINFQKEEPTAPFRLPLAPKQIGDYLKEGYVAQPDALRVDKTKVQIAAELDKKEYKIPTIPTKYPLNFDVTKNLFNGKAEDLNRCLVGTKLEGQGQLFLNAQKKYGINAVFLMSIAKNESGFGASPAREKNGAIHKYNIAGLTTGSKIPGHRFQNPVNYAACIDSLCKNLIKHYISQHHTTISSIQKTYAPGNKEWANSIKNTMGELSTTIMKPYRTTPKNHKDKKAVAKK